MITKYEKFILYILQSFQKSSHKNTCRLAPILHVSSRNPDRGLCELSREGVCYLHNFFLNSYAM